jgi:hypothetical protein
MDEIVWNYVGNGEFIDGVPARGLTQQDVDWLHEDLRSAVEYSKLYRRVERPTLAEAQLPDVKEVESAGADRLDVVTAGSGRAGGAKGKKE